MPSTAQSAAYKTDKTPALGVDVPGGTFQGLRGLSSLSSYPPLPHPWSSSRTLATPCSLPLLPQHFPEHRTSYYVPGHLSPALQHLTHGHTLTPTCKCLESRNLVFCFFPTPPQMRHSMDHRVLTGVFMPTGWETVARFQVLETEATQSI